MTLYLNGVIEEQNGAFFYNLSHVFLFWALSRQTIFNPSGQLNRARAHVWGEKLCCEKSRDSTRSKPWINLNWEVIKHAIDAIEAIDAIDAIIK